MGSGCKPSGALAGVRTEGEPTSAAHVPSGTGRPGWELHSAGPHKDSHAQPRPAPRRPQPRGKVTMATGPGAGGQGAGLGGGGQRGVRSLLCLQGFPQQWLLRSFLSPPPPPRLSLPPPLAASASKQPARPPQATRPLCRGTRRGRAQHSHSLTLSLAHAQTHAAPAGSLPFLPFSPSFPARSRSLSQNEAPGPAEGGAAPTGPAPSLRGMRKRERGREREAGWEDC